MRKLFIESALFFMPFFIVPLTPSFALAGLEDASPNPVAKKDFRPWCGKVNNDCTVTITSDRIIVNSGDGISKNQIIGVVFCTELGGGNPFFPMEPNYTTDIYYTDNGEEKSGKFIFRAPRKIRVPCGLTSETHCGNLSEWSPRLRQGQFFEVPFINSVANYQFKDAIRRLCDLSARRKNKSGET
jgi:hypothetical protein